MNEGDATAEIMQEASDEFGWQLAQASITTERVDAVPRTSPPLSGLCYHVCWEDDDGPRETALYQVLDDETGAALPWFEVPDPRFTAEQMRLLERFVAAKVGPPSRRNADA